MNLKFAMIMISLICLSFAVEVKVYSENAQAGDEILILITGINATNIVLYAGGESMNMSYLPASNAWAIIYSPMRDGEYIWFKAYNNSEVIWQGDKTIKFIPKSIVLSPLEDLAKNGIYLIATLGLFAVIFLLLIFASRLILRL